MIDHKTARNASDWLESAVSGIAEELAETVASRKGSVIEARARLRRLEGLSKDLSLVVGALKRVARYSTR